MKINKMPLFFSIFVLCISVQGGFAQTNLLANPGMEETNAVNVAGWNTWAFNPTAQFVQSSNVAHSGVKSAMINCTEENDARYVQNVAVKAEASYRISGWIKTENVGGAVRGANLSLVDTFIASSDVKGTSGTWIYIELYVKMDPGVKSVNVGAGIGGYGNTNTGTAYFDDLSMEEVSSVPANATMNRVPAQTISDTVTKAENTTGGDFRLFRIDIPANIGLFFVWIGIALALFFSFFILIRFNHKLLFSTYEGLLAFFTHIFIPPAGEYKGIRKITGSPYTRPVFFLVTFIILGAPFIWDIGRSIVVDPYGGAENHYLYQAQAMLQGRLDIPGYLHDVAVFQGKYWVIYPPFPVIFIIPFVAIFGLTTKVTYIALAIALWSVILLWKILKKIEADPKSKPWIIFAFIFGTGFWLCIRGSLGVCWFAHVCSAFALLLALNEVLGKSRGILTGLFIGFAFLSRQFCLFFFPFLLVATWLSKKRGSLADKLTQAALLCAGIAVCIGIYLLYNQARFGNPLDTGYAYLELGGNFDVNVKKYGLFSFTFLPFNAVYMFLQGFHINYGDWPTGVTNVHEYWPTDPYGTSIIAASPFIFFALKAKWDKRLLVAMWASIVIVMLGGLLYYNNGWVQYNTQRFSIDFFPALMVLVALGVKHAPGEYWKPLIVFAVFVNAITMLIIPTAG